MSTRILIEARQISILTHQQRVNSEKKIGDQVISGEGTSTRLYSVGVSLVSISSIAQTFILYTIRLLFCIDLIGMILYCRM